MNESEYRCIQGHGKIVTDEDGHIGQIRDGKFFPATQAGKEFWRKSPNNPMSRFT